jgi:transposase
MYVAQIPNHGSHPTYLLRKSYREDGKVKTRTVGNITSLGLEKISLIAHVLKGNQLLPAEEAFKIIRSRPHGHVDAILRAIRQLGLDTLYAAMDWMLKRQSRIEQKLAKRHLSEGSMALYDIYSSYVEGERCPLAKFGHHRDGKNGKKIIVCGLLTDSHGRPISIQTYPGNTHDSTTVIDQVEKISHPFGMKQSLMVFM